MRSEDGQVVCQHFGQGFTLAAGVGAPAQAAAESALDAGVDAFALPALSIFAPVKAALHLPTVAGLGPFAPVAAGIKRNDRAADAQPLPGQDMVVFAVIARIGQEPVNETQVAGRLPCYRAKLRRVLAGAPRGQGTGH